MDRQPLKRQRSQDHENPDPLELEEWIILQKAKRLRIGLNNVVESSELIHHLHPHAIETLQPSSSMLQAAPTQNTHHFALRPMIISTRSQAPTSTEAQRLMESQQTVETSSEYYNSINSYLHSLHVKRYGDPEEHERWWERENDTMDMDDESDTKAYAAINSVLRQAFLRRHLGQNAPHEN